MNLFHAHSRNLRALDNSLTYTAIAVKRELRHSQTVVADIHTKIYALLLGAWAECRLNKLLEKKGGFDEKQVSSIRNGRTIQDKWDRLIKTAFKHHYKVNKRITEKKLGHTAYARYSSLLDIVRLQLFPIIHLRNKLAHGQLVYPLNNEMTEISTDSMRALNTENILTLQYKRTLLGHIIDLIECLAMSKPAFERDYDRYYDNIITVVSRINDVNYRKFAERMKSSK